MAECGGIEAYAARPLRARVTECHFGFYSSDEIRALSVLNITSTETFDDLGNPIPGGLNDPKLGPTSRNEICPTCGLDDKECSGHMGHIELPLPTYHPLLMDHTYLLLRSQCAHCQRLRLSEPEKRAAAISLYLYKRGRWQEAEELASKLAACEADAKDEKDRQKKKVTLKKNSKSKAKAAQEAKKKKAAVASGEKEKAGLDFGSDDSSSSSDDSSSEESGDTEESDPTTEEEEEEEDPNRVDVHTILLGYEKRFGFQTGGEADAIEDTNKTKASSTAADKNEKDIPLLSSFERSLRHQYIKSLLDTIIHTKKCGQCGGFSPTIRKDGYTKFFVKNLPRNYKNSNRRLGLSTFDEVPAITQATSTGTASALSLPPAIGAKSPTTAGSTSNKEDEAYMSEDEIDKRREMEDMKKKQEEQMEESAVSTKQKFLPPSEVEQRISSLWSFGVEGRMLEEIYGKMLHGDTIELQKKSTTTPVVPVSQTKQVQKPRGEGHETWRLFFVSVIAVPPPRFRPAAVIGGVTAENPQNVQLTKVMSIASKIRGMQGASAATSSNGGQLWKEGEDRLAALFSSWIDLQINVNGFMDASKASGGGGSSAQNDIPVFGIRQLLEKKQGLFRMNMMGKRVNHACRSVISPDLNVRAGEIGLPLRFAKALSWPENVSVHNVAALRVLVERGCDSYPGANWVRDAQGNMVNLERLPLNRRQGLAKRLLAGEGQTVGRHLVDGDMVIMNRQPTLHKPSMMAHQVRVFKYLPDSQQTIRMHYANCNSYNADFDGDEMNCHLPMSLLAKSESQHIVHNPHQYIVPTDGSPVRGLIQDHVDSAVKLSQKDCFLPKDLFLQLLSPAAHVLGCVLSSDLALHLPPPAILKPRQLYTGKQLFTTILSLLVQHNCPEAVTKHTITRTVEAGGAGVVKKGKSSKSSKSSPATASLKITKHIGLCMENKSKTPDWAYGASSLEHKPLWSNGYFARGILDKSAIGASGAGLIHSIFEMYGAHASSAMLDAIGRCLSLFLQYAGHSCGIADLVLKPDAEESRRALLQQSSKTAISAAAEFLKISNKENQLKAAAVGGASGGGSDSANSVENEADIRKGLGRLLSGTNEEEALAACAALDSEMQSSLNTTSSEVVKVCLPDGLKFPVWSPGPNSGGKHANGFALMVSTGAKGSKVNQSQVTVCLGQQALEGRRVPHMVSGKTLPSFRPWAHTTDARAGGFVSDRFLTGLRPQEYYFHCMGGREGLVDTAVKTSRSGYLQRCLVKGLEELTVAYDHSVRDSAGNVVQFQYGEDGLDVTRSYFLQSDEKTMAFLNSNLSTFNKTYNLEEEEEEKNNEEKNLKISALEAHSHVNKWKNQISKQMLSSRNTQKKSSGSASIELVKLNVGDVVQARRLKKDSKEKNGSSSWGRDQLQAGWYAATITNITSTGIPTSSPSKADKKAKKKASSLESGFVGKSAAASFLDVYSPEELLQVRADIRYDDDGSVEKNVPLVVNWKFSEAQKQQFENVESTQRYADAYSVPIVLSPGHDLLPHYAKIIPPVYGHHRHLQAHTPGVLSEKMNDTIINFEKVIQKKNPSFVSSNNVKKSSFRKMVEEKWCRSLAAPGEAVGCLAAQSVGEPSTQMTLNTFHLAGHGGANVTLGIPRLRELLMTASRSLKTPNMTIPLANAQPNDKSSKEFLAQQATAYSMSRQIQKLTLNEILSSDGGVVVKESVEPFIVSTQNTGGSGNHQHNISQYCRKYEITIKLQPPKLIKKAFGIKWKLLAKVLKTQFYKKLAKIVNMELKRGDKDVRLFLDDMSNGFESDEEDDVAQDGMNIEHSDLNDMLQEDAMNDSDNEEGVSSKVKARGGQAKKAGKKGGLGNKSSGGKQAAQMGESDSDGDSDSDEGGEEDGTLRVGKKLKEKKAYEEEESDSDSDSDDGDKAKKSRGALGGLIDDEAEEASGSDSDSDSDRHERKGASQKKREKEALKLKAKLASPSKSPSSKKGSMTEEMTSNCNMIETKDGIRFNLLAPARAGRVLMVSLAERAAEITVVKEMEGLSSAHVVERDIKVMKSYDEVEKQKRWALFTEGCNFHSIWSLEARVQFRTPNTPLFDLNRLKSNDVGAVLVVYGVEAARLNIMNEVRGVFDVYGIEVDQRHLSLIADTMTFGGGFRPFNRIGIGEATSSPFLQMSFETTAGFLTAAAVAGEPDRLTSPSARIVMGQIPKQGTGAFELRSTIA